MTKAEDHDRQCARNLSLHRAGPSRPRGDGPQPHLHMHERQQQQHRVSASRNFFLIACICIAEPFSSVLLLPFIYFMVRDFGYAEADIGFHAGLIMATWLSTHVTRKSELMKHPTASAFFVVQIFSTPAWCAISDRLGRKPCMIFGLLGTAVMMVLFGLSSSLAWAVVTRALCGLLNGNLAIARTVVGELSAATGVDKGRAFSLFGFCVATGWMLGPFIGGSLASPSQNLGFRGPWNISSALLLDETVGLASGSTGPDSRRARHSPLGNDERRPLLASGTPSLSPERIDAGPHFFRNIQILALVSSVFFFIHIISFDELYALFAASSSEDGIGLSFQSPQIALSLSFAGPAMIIALLAFPSLHRDFGSVPLYICSGILFVWLYPLFSLLPALDDAVDGSTVLWVVLVTMIMLRYAAMVIGLASLQVLINDTAHPRQRAFINGLAQSVGSFSRAVGPSLGGSVWSWSLKSRMGFPLDFHAMFLLLSLLGAAQIATSVWIPKQEEIERVRKAWEWDSD
ncbi:peptide/nitrate transporter-like protein [Podospora aff. communis PSN243]|uniref:Peptide/nitrate transporter-like protein n=1 Tax=Podospora aff. communis PSN243 TaxID=3040156 RepID=A0AAV9GIP1_9PEZI|nr:peptide/nitrate transporter-like protein [Podospora aff. communis PSN243]